MSSAGEVRDQLEAVFGEALDAVDAGVVLRGAVARRGETLEIAGRAVPHGSRVLVLAAGKAAAVMAAALEEVAGDRVTSGLVVTVDGRGEALSRLALREAAHPVPDPRSEAAAREALALVEATRPEDTLLVLLSGGASSLLACPAPGLDLADVADTTAALLASGAEIEELNAVRKHLSAVSGGRLARAARCRRIEVLAVSDVPGDRIDVIASGPFAADPTRYEDALRCLDARDVRSRVPTRVLAHLEAGARGEREETPKPGEASTERVRTTLLATNATAVVAAVAAAERRGLRPVALPGALRGEARRAGRRFGALASAVETRGAPVCVVAGGETAVTVRGAGRGGRSQELALAAALEWSGAEGCALLAAGTDGRDGPTDAAGAFADGGTVSRARELGLDARAALADNDSYGFFAALGGLLHTGPTRTNVMDLVLVRIA